MNTGNILAQWLPHTRSQSRRRITAHSRPLMCVRGIKTALPLNNQQPSACVSLSGRRHGNRTASIRGEESVSPRHGEEREASVNEQRERAHVCARQRLQAGGRENERLGDVCVCAAEIASEKGSVSECVRATDCEEASQRDKASK